MPCVLVTGAAGAIGEPVCEELARRGHHVRGFDLRPGAVADFVVADLEDRSAVQHAMQGVDAVVHLGAHPDEAPFEQLVVPNVIGLFNVLDAARSARVRRVVLASSVQVVFGRSGSFLSTADRRPTNHYGLTKLWAEDMGEMYARCFEMSIIAARISWMVRNRHEAERMIAYQAFAQYLSRGDVARFFAQAVTAAHIGFAVLYVAGPRGSEVMDLESSRRLIGYEPQDEWPQGLPPDAAELVGTLS